MRVATSGLQELVDAAVVGGTLTYCQLGAFHTVENARPRLHDDLRIWGLEPTDLRADDGSVQRWCKEASAGHIGLLLDLELTLPPGASEETLAQLRPGVQDALARGASILITSRVPLLEFPALAGSSILLDARKVSLRPLSLADSVQWLADRHGGAEETLERVASFAYGSRALLEAFLGVDQLDESVSGRERMRRVESAERAVALQVFRELGHGVRGWLDYWVHDCQQFQLDDVDLPSTPLIEALRNAGVLRQEESGLVLVPFSSRDLWLEALAESIDGDFEPSKDWLELIGTFYKFERDLRFELQAHYRSRHGAGWPTTVLSGKAASILELARRDGCALADDLIDLRSPLEWLTLGALLELIMEEVEGGARFLGCDLNVWRNVYDEVRPVRNRVAHMRGVRSGDADIVRRRLKFIELRRRRA